MKFEDADSFPYFEFSENLAQALASKTQSENYELFRLLVAYNCCKVASLMGAMLKTPHTGDIPINAYVINLAPSGENKGFSMAIMENHVLSKFKEQYINVVAPKITASNIELMAMEKSKGDDKEYEAQFKRINNELKDCGEFVYSFDSGTTPAIKQYRHRMLLTKVGSINLEMDEIGSNLVANTDIMAAFLELYDIGRIKQKLIKNTADNTRAQDLDGCTPTNALLYGTPSKLFDGNKTEEEYMSFIDAGYGRRCFYSFTSETKNLTQLSVDDLYDRLTNKNSNTTLEDLAEHFKKIAHTKYHGLSIEIPEEVFKEWLHYKIACEAEAASLSEFDNMRKTELKHRHFKTLKLAAGYSFCTGSKNITMEALHGAIRVAQDSGKAFCRMLSRDKPYVKLAKYLASSGREVTPTDLMEELPFYKGSSAARNELFILASSWGYKNGIVLSKNYVDGIEFLKAEALPVNDLSQTIISHSSKMAEGYTPAKVPFNKLTKMLQKPAYNFCNHHFVDNHRNDDNVISGVNMLILDVDEGMTIQEALQIFKKHNYYMYTTKRHTESEHRFRILLPLSHNLKLNKQEYTEFVENVLEYYPLPIVDDASTQRSKKWLTNDGDIYSNFDGENIDALLFIPRSTKSDNLKKDLKELKDVDGIERWFLFNTGNGNRNNQLAKYAFFLKDCGKSIDEVTAAVLALNNKLPNSMSDQEMYDTILTSVAKRFAKDEK